MHTLDEIELLITQESSAWAGHFIQPRREREDRLQIVAVPVLPIAFNPLLISYELYSDGYGLQRIVRRINWIFLSALTGLWLLLVVQALTGDAADHNEIPWIFGVLIGYGVAKAFGIYALHRYIRSLKTRLGMTTDLLDDNE